MPRRGGYEAEDIRMRRETWEIAQEVGWWVGFHFASSSSLLSLPFSCVGCTFLVCFQPSILLAKLKFPSLFLCLQNFATCLVVND